MRLLDGVIEELEGLCDREEAHGRYQEVDEKFTRVGELIELARKAVGEDDCDLAETLLAEADALFEDSAEKFHGAIREEANATRAVDGLVRTVYGSVQDLRRVKLHVDAAGLEMPASCEHQEEKMAGHKRSIHHTWGDWPVWMADRLEACTHQRRVQVHRDGTRLAYAELHSPAYRPASSGGVDWQTEARVLFNTWRGEVRYIPAQRVGEATSKNQLVFVRHVPQTSSPLPRFCLLRGLIQRVQDPTVYLSWPRTDVIELPGRLKFDYTAYHMEALCAFLGFQPGNLMLRNALKTTVVVLDKI